MRAFVSSYFIAASFMFIRHGYESVFSPRRSSRHKQGTSLQTSHPAGRCPHHGPAFGTGELQEGGTTLLDGGFRARPDNGDVPLDPYARAALQPGFHSQRQSGHGLQHRALWYHALGRIPPQSDQKSPCHRHHHDLAHALSRATNALAKPNDLSRAGLVTLPEPGQLDHHGSQTPIAGLVDPLLALRTPAAERRRRKPGVGTKCLAIGEFAHERLPDQNGGALHTDSP